jgi:glutamate--cysteine ligase
MNMKERNISAIAEYLAGGEKKSEGLKIGIEAEHFVVSAETGFPSSHIAEKGGSPVLRALKKHYPEEKFSDGELVGLEGGGESVSLEPGGQLEFSLEPKSGLKEIEEAYRSFLERAGEALLPLGCRLAAEGYLPKGGIGSLPLLKKRRYLYMYDYFGKSGLYGRNMMKGTAALQASVDYVSETDFSSKLRIASILSLPLYRITSNAKSFEGGKAQDLARLRIWQNTDPDRCGIVPGSLDKAFSYEDYARCLYGSPALVALSAGEPYYPGKRTLEEVFCYRPMGEEDVAYALSMAFFDARAIRFLEIRPADSMPMDASIGYFALIKALFYTDCLEKLGAMFEGVGGEEYEASLKSLLGDGERASLYGRGAIELCIEILDMAYNALPEREKAPLASLKSFFLKKGPSHPLPAHADTQRSNCL